MTTRHPGSPPFPLRILSVLVLLLAGLALSAAPTGRTVPLAQAQPTTTTAGSTTTSTAPTTSMAPPSTTATPILKLEDGSAFRFVLLLGLALLLVWLIPVILDTRAAYRLRNRAIDLLNQQVVRLAGSDGLTVNELQAVLAAVGRPATGQRGLARAVMALSIITVVAITLFALLLSGAPDASDLRKTALTALLSVLATIVGFYFGTRAAEGEGARAPGPTANGQPQAPSPKEPTSPTGQGRTTADSSERTEAAPHEPSTTPPTGATSGQPATVQTVEKERDVDHGSLTGGDGD